MMIGPPLAALKGLGRSALALVLPPRCLACAAVVDAPGTICAECWSRIAFLGPPQCSVCGYPFDFDLGPAALCGGCARDLPGYRRARAVMRYDESSRGLVLAFKHSDRTDAAPAFGAWMARAGAELLADAQLIVPVPLHRLRLLSRRYNQSAMLAHALGRASLVPVVADLLVRTRRTPSQGGLNRAARERNVRGAFAVRQTHAERVRHRQVLLVDDVLTTGATVAACARALIGAGAAAVDVLTLARVVRPAT